MQANNNTIRNSLTRIQTILNSEAKNTISVDAADSENSMLSERALEKARKRYLALREHYQAQYQTEFKKDPAKVYHHFITQHIFPRINAALTKNLAAKCTEIQRLEAELASVAPEDKAALTEQLQQSLRHKATLQSHRVLEAKHLEVYLRDPQADNPIHDCVGQDASNNILHRLHTALRGLIMPEACVYTAIDSGRLRCDCPAYQYANRIHLNSKHFVYLPDNLSLPLTEFLAIHLLAAMDPKMDFNDLVIADKITPSKAQYVADSIDMAIWTLAQITQAHNADVTKACQQAIKAAKLEPLDSPSCSSGTIGRISIDLSRSNPIGQYKTYSVAIIPAIIEDLIVKAFTEQSSSEVISETEQAQAFNAFSLALLLIPEEITPEDEKAFNRFLGRCAGISAQQIIAAVVAQVPELRSLSESGQSSKISNLLLDIRDHLLLGLNFSEPTVQASQALINRIMMQGAKSKHSHDFKQAFKLNHDHARIMLQRAQLKLQVFDRLVQKEMIRAHLFPRMVNQAKLTGMLGVLEGLNKGCFAVEAALHKQAQARQQRITEHIRANTGFKAKAWTSGETQAVIAANHFGLSQDIDCVKQIIQALQARIDQVRTMQVHPKDITFIKVPFQAESKNNFDLIADYLFALALEKDFDGNYADDFHEIKKIIVHLVGNYPATHKYWQNLFLHVKERFVSKIKRDSAIEARQSILFDQILKYAPQLRPAYMQACIELDRREFVSLDQIISKLVKQFGANETAALFALEGPFAIPEQVFVQCRDLEIPISVSNLLGEAKQTMPVPLRDYAVRLRDWLQHVEAMFVRISADQRARAMALDFSDFIVVSFMQSLKIEKMKQSDYNGLKYLINLYLKRNPKDDYIKNYWMPITAFNQSRPFMPRTQTAGLRYLSAHLILLATQLVDISGLFATGAISLISRFSALDKVKAAAQSGINTPYISRMSIHEPNRLGLVYFDADQGRSVANFLNHNTLDQVIEDYNKAYPDKPVYPIKLDTFGQSWDVVRLNLDFIRANYAEHKHRLGTTLLASKDIFKFKQADQNVLTQEYQAINRSTMTHLQAIAAYNSDASEEEKLEETVTLASSAKLERDAMRGAVYSSFVP